MPDSQSGACAIKDHIHSELLQITAWHEFSLPLPTASLVLMPDRRFSFQAFTCTGMLHLKSKVAVF